MHQTCSIAGGATSAPWTEATANARSVYTGLVTPITSHQCLDIGALTGSQLSTRPYSLPTKARTSFIQLCSTKAFLLKIRSFPPPASSCAGALRQIHKLKQGQSA